MTQLTLQTAFDTMQERLYDGRGQAIEFGSCTLRTKDGVPCVVGALLPDDHPMIAEYPNVGVDDLIENFPDETPDVIIRNFGFMTQMQEAHDEPLFWNHTTNMPNDKMKAALSHIAEKYGVTLS